MRSVDITRRYGQRCMIIFNFQFNYICLKKIEAACFGLLFSAVSYAQPDSVQATYDVHKSALRVEITDSYARDKDHYTLSSIWKPVGLLAALLPEKIVINSAGIIGKQGLKPQHFTHKRERDSNRNSRAEFDWAGKQLTLSSHGQQSQVELPPDTQDRLSAMYQFMFLPLHNAATLDFHMTDGSKLDSYHYALTHQRTIKVPAGEYQTIYLDSQAKPGESRTEIWLATQYYNLPCKMVITEANGDQFTQVLSKLEIRP